MAGEINVDTGTGVAIAFATSSFAAQLTNLDTSGMSRDAIDVSHMGTTLPSALEMGNREFIESDLIDPGELSGTFHFDVGVRPPVNEVLEQITITWPKTPTQAVAATWVGNGFFISNDQAIPLGDKMVQSGTIKMSGKWTLALGTT